MTTFKQSYAGLSGLSVQQHFAWQTWHRNLIGLARLTQVFPGAQFKDFLIRDKFVSVPAGDGVERVQRMADGD